MTLSLLGAAGAVCFVLLTLTAVQDMRTLRISNVLVVAMIAAFALRLPVLELNEILARLIGAAAFFAVTFLLFLTGRFGAGDSKMLAAFALHVPSELLGSYLVILAVVGLMCVAVVFGLRATFARLGAPDAGGWRAWAIWRVRDRFPYGLPIALAGVTVLGLEFALATARAA